MEGMEHQRSAVESDCFIPNSKISHLINNLTRMAKNPSVESDLSQVLDEFLEKLGECDKYLQNGIMNMNFAEAALLLQNSADVYSKKVDLLWDIIFDYQKRMLLSEENGDKQQELEKVEERKRKYKRKRKTNTDERETTKLVNNFSFGQTENFDYLSQCHDTIDLSSEWAKFDSKEQTSDDCHQLTAKKFLFLSDERIHSEDNTYIGRYDQFHSNSLVEEIFHLEEQKLLADDYNCVTKMRIDTYVINDFLLQNNIPATSPKEKYMLELNKYINDFLQMHKHPEKHSGVSDSVLEQLCPRKSVVCLQRLPLNILKDTFRRASLADSLFGDDMSTTSEHCPSPYVCGVDETFEQVGGSLENRSKSCSQDSAFYEDGEEHITNEEGCTENGVTIDGATVSNEEGATEAVISADGDTEAIISTDGDTEAVISTGGATINNEGDAGVGADEDTEDPVPDCVLEAASTEDVDHTVHVAAMDHDYSLNPCSSGVNELQNDNGVETRVKRKQKSPVKTTKPSEDTPRVVTRHKVGRKWSFILNDVEIDDEEQEVKKRRVQKRVSEKVLKRLASGLTATYRDFEIFCRLHYKTGDGEGLIQAFALDSEESDEDLEHMSGEEEEHEEAPSPVHTDEETSDLEETQETEKDSCEDQEISLSQPTERQDTPAILNSTISPIPTSNLPSCSKSNTDLRTSTPCTSQVMGKKLFALSDVDFEQEEICRKNVKEWRSFITPKLAKMEHKADFDIHEYGSRIIEPSKIGEERHFKDIVRGKNAAEVARFFIATLQLANTCNVEISGAIPGEVANDSFKIKVLDKTKHHELLEDYQAPSEETFKERLERAKALNPKVPLHSSRGPPAKKPKFASFRRLGG